MEKVGFHYRMDSDHYSEKDLATWLPRLKELDASWIVLNAPTNRAIPEGFIPPLRMEGSNRCCIFRITPRDLSFCRGNDPAL